MADTSLTDGQKIQRNVEAMRQERTSFISHYKELSEFIQPRRGRFFITDRNKGDKRFNRIINSIGTMALRTCASGMFAGTMSPAQPWFALETEDLQLMDYAPVAQFCYDVTTLFQRILASSNFYNQTPIMLGEMIQFGTGCLLHVDDYQDVARFYTQTVGSYMIGQNNRMEIDCLVREFEWTVGQIVAEFGYDNCSRMVKDAYDKGNYNVWYPVTHFIGANDTYDTRKLESKYTMPFKGCYYEPSQISSGQFLREQGFAEFPAYCPRWETTGEDIYGTNCPGMTAMGDVKGIQIQEKRKAQAIDKVVNPPLKGPASLRNVPISSLPGGATLYDGSGGDTLQPIYQIQPQIDQLSNDIQRVETRINTAFFVDLFLAISQMEGIQPRNQLDLTERNQERLLQLGPVLERLQGEFQNKLFDRLFKQCVRAGIIGGPRGIQIPPELAGKEIKISYVSPVAMAQRQSATANIEKVASFVSQVAQVFPSAVDKIDMDEAIDDYSKAVGVNPKMVLSDDKVKAIRDQRAQQEQQQQQQEQAAMAANTAKTASQAQTSQPSALTSIAGALQGGDQQ